MKVILNGEPENIDVEKNVVDFLKGLELNPDIVTVNLNGSILSKENLAATILREGDQIDVLMFMGGGY